MPDNSNNNVTIDADEFTALCDEVRPCSDKQMLLKRTEALRRIACPLYIYQMAAEPPWHLMAACKVLTMDAKQLCKWQSVYNSKANLSSDPTVLACLIQLLGCYMDRIQARWSCAQRRLSGGRHDGAVTQLWLDRLAIVQLCAQLAAQLLPPKQAA